MTNIKKNLLFLICLLVVQAAQCALPIQIEAKTLGKDVVFIFFRDKEHIVDIKSQGNLVSASLNVPSGFKIANPSIFNKFAKNVKLAPNKQQISFYVNDAFKYHAIINGEKLEAIKFKTTEIKKEDLTNIGSTNNDPASIKYSKTEDDHLLSFNMGNNNSKVAAFYRGKYMWIIFDQKKVFSSKDLESKDKGGLSKFELIPSDKGTTLRMVVDPAWPEAELKPVQSGWEIKIPLKENKDKRAQNILVPEILQSQHGFLIKGDFAQNEIITFEDPELGEAIKAVPVASKGGRVLEQSDAVEYSLLKSIQGIALALHSDDAQVEKNADSLKVISDATPTQDQVIKNNIFPASIDEALNMPSLLPYLDKDLDILDYNQQKSRLISEASQSIDKTEGFLKNFVLSKFYFIQGLYPESLDALKLAQFISPEEYQMNLPARVLMAVNYTLVGERALAKDEFDALLVYDEVKKNDEINIWNKYNEYSIGANPGSIGIIDISQNMLSLYTDDKYWPLIFAEIEIALLGNDLKLLERIFKEVRAPKDQDLNSLKYYKAAYHKKKNQDNLAKQFYLDLSSQEYDLFNKVRADFELTKLLVEKGELSPAKAAEALEKLRFRWRGDQLEYQILLQLAAYYRESRDMLNALRTFQYAQTAFSSKVSNFYITSEMAMIFNDVFLPGGLGEQMDDFTIVALFFEFKELNPIGDQGDDVIIGIAKRLVKLDLLENASELLRHQITYRLQDMKRVTNADNLAVILMMDKKPSEAILILDDTDKDNFNFNEHQYRIRLRAQALIALGKYDEAISYLKDDSSEDSEIIRREALFKAEYWSKYIDQVMPDFDELITKVGDKGDAPQYILRLATSYYMMNANDKLVMISNAIGTKNPVLKNTVDLLILGSGTVDYRNLDQSLAIDQMKSLLNKYKDQFLK